MERRARHDDPEDPVYYVAMHDPEGTVNGQPGLIAQRGGTTVTVFAFDVTGDHITRIWAIPNPDKLRPWTAD
jgi:hypothetical protein